MTLQTKDVKPFVGKSIVDSYGRIIGRMIGFSVSLRNEITSVEIELGNGDFSSFPANQISIGDDSIVFIPAWKANSNALSEEYASTLHRVSVLKELYNKGDLQPEIYDDFSKKHEDLLNELETRRSALLASLKDEIVRLNAKIKELQTFIANIKVEHLTGEIDDQAYDTATNAAQMGLEKIYLEKKDLEITLDEITKITILSSTPIPASEQPIAKIVEQIAPTPETSKEAPIVVRLKESSL